MMGRRYAHGKGREVPTRHLSTVYHIGDLDREREPPHVSYEGRGLSVSTHPEAWGQIPHKCRGAGGEPTTYELTNDQGQFYDAVPGGPPCEQVVGWCLDHMFVTEVYGFEVTWTRSGSEETERMLFYDRETAQREASEPGRELDSTKLLALDIRGEWYWEEAFEKPVAQADPLVVRGLTPVWFAGGHDFDGVWWDEELDVSRYSAPRGVIFQDALSSWSRSSSSSGE